MEKYIPKSALVAWAKETYLCENASMIRKVCYKQLLEHLDTLEVKEVPIWEKVSPDTGQTTLYKDGGKSYLERFGYRIDLKDLDKLPKKNPKAQEGEKI